jgi:histidinol-phosphatase
VRQRQAADPGPLGGTGLRGHRGGSAVVSVSPVGPDHDSGWQNPAPGTATAPPPGSLPKLHAVAGTLEADLALALRLADEADAVSMADFRPGRDIDFNTKPDGSPVAVADRAVEETIGKILSSERPDDGLLGEEIGGHGSTRRRWIVDGVDGTVLFVKGKVGWATEIALEVDGRVVIGVSTSPAQGRRWWAGRGSRAWVSDHEGATPLRVSTHPRLDHGRYSFIPPIEALGEDHAHLGDALATCMTYVPPVHHGALLVAEGLAEVCVQTDGGPWDFAALAVIVEEAGGSFSDLVGSDGIYGGGVRVYSNSAVHTQALGILQP